MSLFLILGRTESKNYLQGRLTGCFARLFRIGLVWKAFWMIQGAEVGRETTLAVMQPAHRCTHAVVILSPNFRKRRYPVMELNTFSDRAAAQPDFRLIPFLWNITDASEYSSSIDNRIWGSGLGTHESSGSS